MYKHKNINDMKKALFIIAAILCFVAAQAQDEYRIEQVLDARMHQLSIAKDWNVKLFIEPFLDSDRVEIVTPCPYYFEQENEPKISCFRKHSLTLWNNTVMPHGTVVEIYHREPIETLHIQPGATFSIDTLPMTLHMDSSRVHGVLIKVMRGATLNIGLLASRKNIGIELDTNATVHIGTVSCPKLSITSEKGSQIDIDSLDVELCEHGHDYNTRGGNLLKSDPSRHLKVNHRPLHGNLRNTYLGVHFDYEVPLWMNRRYASPYSTGNHFSIIMSMGINQIWLGSHFSTTPKVEFKANYDRLINNVSTDGTTLSLDESFGARQPRQYLYSFSIGVPINIFYQINDYYTVNGNGWSSLIYGFGASLTPYFTTETDLFTRIYGTDEHWHLTKDKASVYRPFNIRFKIWLNTGPFLGRSSWSIFVDLLPTFRNGIGADGLHMMGLSVGL